MEKIFFIIILLTQIGNLRPEAGVVPTSTVKTAKSPNIQKSEKLKALHIF